MRPFLLSFFAAAATAAAQLPPDQLEFFESKIRPVLASECIECHGPEKQKGGLRLDYRDGWKAGGDTAPAIVPGKPTEGLLLRSIRHDDPELQMPKKRPKLSAAVIADFEKWIASGAPDPRDKPSPHATAAPWDKLLAERKTWWSLQPVHASQPPAVQDAAWSSHPVDRFLLARMETAGLSPAPDADARTVYRRLCFALTGLPPSADDAAIFAKAAAVDRAGALAEATTRLLASPRFGEQWARHWLDLVRYAETHGSEGDPIIPEVWRYRDYVIRAFNDDLPLDQFICEHIAGDQIPPRWNAAEGWNEALLGLAHFRLVEHGFQPIDTRDEQIKVVDSQIDVLCKAFQGLTVSCARCHDHKFDAVSQRDYTALAGILESSRPAMLTIDDPAASQKIRADLVARKAVLKKQLAELWEREAAQIPQRARAAAAPAAANRRLDALASDGKDPWAEAIADAVKNPANPLHPWAMGKPPVPTPPALRANLDDFPLLYRIGPGVEDGRIGDFSILPDGDRAVGGLLPAGVGTGSLTRKYGGIASTRRFQITTDFISIRACGANAQCRLIIDGYPLGTNPIFPRAQIHREEPGWLKMDVKYRRGSWAYLEFATASDLTRPEKNDPRSWFSVSGIAAHNDEAGPTDGTTGYAALFSVSDAPLAEQYRDITLASILAWKKETMSEPQRAWLDYFLRHGLLTTSLPQLEKCAPEAAATLLEFRRAEAAVPVPRRAPGVMDADSYDSAFLPRGDHRHPAAPVARGYLGVFSQGTFPHLGSHSGRLELARALTSPSNPLTARVMVNRIWLHLFGQGLVSTPDGFGKMGELPSHPELLDFLAAKFVQDGWSTKKMIRYLVLTRAWQLASEPSPAAQEKDAANVLLSHARVRRLEAESIRDSILALSGRLDATMFGPSVAPLQPRRSIYLSVRRTALNPFLTTFDAPRPFSTLGRRDSTNVPAQSLVLLNDPFVSGAAGQWATRHAELPPAERVQAMFADALGRPATASEAAAAQRYVTDHTPESWHDLAQSLFNIKEFIYLR